MNGGHLRPFTPPECVTVRMSIPGKIADSLGVMASAQRVSSTISVVLIDDNQTYLDIVRRFLEDYSAQRLRVAGVAVNGLEGLRIIDEVKPDVALVDLDMPGISGLTVISEIRKRHPQIRIIVVTLHPESSYRSVSMESGAHDFISKSEIHAKLIDSILAAADAGGP